LCVGAAALDLGGFTAFLYGFNERELIYDITEELSGARFHTSWTRVGGAMSDIGDRCIAMIRDFIRKLPSAIDDVEKLLNKNRIFVERTRGIGYISKEDAINWGLTGPLARASGCGAICARTNRTCATRTTGMATGSSAVDFKVPICELGDVYARYLVRLEELRQSLAIVDELVENIPSGPMNILPTTRRRCRTRRGLFQHRRADPSLRAGDDQPGSQSADRRGVRRE
jgi:NADH-quinone oxidoreductase subunit D